MSLGTFVDKMKSIQNSLLGFLEDESDANEKYENFINLISTQEINNKKQEFKALLQLINRIGCNHHRAPNFISKVERVLRQFKQDLPKFFSNSEIFDIFKDNKRILLFLLEEKMMIIDEYIFSIITSGFYVKKNYCEYFQPEIKPFLTQENIEKYGGKNKSLKDDKFIERMNKEIEANFYEKRREGESDDYLCKLIRFDKIKEFVRFVEQTNLPLENKIKKSIFETNQLLDICNVTMLKYASFFGSIKIINYLIRKTKVNSEIWIYSIHTNNVKMIHLLEDYQIEPDLQQILRESIRCYHNNISNYIINNLIKEEDLRNDIENDYYHNLYQYAVEYQNWGFFPTNMKYKNMFLYLCECNCYTLVKLYLKELTIDINEKIKTLII